MGIRPAKFLIVLGVVAFGLVAGVLVTPALATGLSNTAITASTFSSAFCTPAVGTLTSPFDFSGSGGATGSLISNVFKGSPSCATPSDSLFAYEYQLSVTSGTHQLTGVSVPFIDLAAFPGSGGANTSFFISNGGGTIAPSGADINPSTSAGTLTFRYGTVPITPGTTSMFFGAVSKDPFGIASAGLLDTVAESTFALVPAPEPSSLMLLSPGALGLVSMRLRRRRSQARPIDLSAV